MLKDLLLTGVLGGGWRLVTGEERGLEELNDLLKVMSVNGGELMSLGLYDFKAWAVSKPRGWTTSPFPAKDGPVCPAPVTENGSCPPCSGLVLLNNPRLVQDRQAQMHYI